MKRILSLILAVALTLGTLALASCGKKNDTIKVNPDKENYAVQRACVWLTAVDPCATFCSHGSLDTISKIAWA